MSDLLQDTYGDLEFTNNSLTFVEGADEVVQRLRQRLRSFLGEWFLNTSLGIPYLQEILKKNPQHGIVDAILKKHILNTPGVIKLLEYSYVVDSSARTSTLTFKVLSVDGPIDLEETY